VPTMNSVSGAARQYAEGDGVRGRDAGVCDALLLVPVGRGVWLDGGITGRGQGEASTNG